MYQFHYDCIENKYDNNLKLLFTDTDSLMYKIKTEDVYEDFNNDKEMLTTKAKYYHNWNKFVGGKMKDETACVAIEEIVGLNPKMYSHLVDDNSEHKKIVATIRRNEYKDVLQNKKYFRYSINRIQSKDHRIGNN